jgi:hypothetical protein
MAIKKRLDKRRGAISAHEAAWLRGVRKEGFMYSLNHTFIREELWDRAGDLEAMCWEPGMQYPEPR